MAGKLIARSALNRLRRGWKCTMLTCLPTWYRQDCAFTLCSIPRARLQHGIETLEKMKRYSIRGFFCNRAGRLQNACRVLLSKAGSLKSALRKQRCCRGRLFSSEFISWPPSKLSSILRTGPRMPLILCSLFYLGRCFRWDLCVKVLERG